MQCMVAIILTWEKLRMVGECSMIMITIKLSDDNIMILIMMMINLIG